MVSWVIDRTTLQKPSHGWIGWFATAWVARLDTWTQILISIGSCRTTFCG